MTPIPDNVYEMKAVTLSELRGYIKELWANRDWDAWITDHGYGSLKQFSLHIGGKTSQGTPLPAESYHGSTRQQAMFRARLHLVALLRSSTLATFGYGLEGLNALRGRMGMELLDGQGQRDTAADRGAPGTRKKAQGSTEEHQPATTRSGRGVRRDRAKRRR